MKKILAFILFAALISAAMPSAVRADDAAPAAPPKADAPKETPKSGGEGGAKPPADVSGGRFAGDPVYVHLAPMVLPVIGDSGAEQLVTLQIDVEVKDFDVADQMHTIMPKVMDALMTSLYGGLGQGSLRNGKLVDVGRVKTKATSALESVLGAGNVKNVLIQGVAQRML